MQRHCFAEASRWPQVVVRDLPVQRGQQGQREYLLGLIIGRVQW